MSEMDEAPAASETEHDLELEIRVEARPETVFAFLTDPGRYRLWMGRTAELDPRPGGTYRVDVNGTNSVVGEYLLVEPPSRVVFTWGWVGSDEVPPGSTTVELTLVPQGEATIVRLRHSGLPSSEQREQHGHGWRHYLDRLAVAAAGGDPGLDPMDAG